MEKATILCFFRLAVNQSMLISCAATGKSSGVITSREATAIWHVYEILPNYHYYYAGPDAQPFYVVAIDDRYKLMAKLWKSVDLTPEMLRNWFNYLRPWVGYSPYHYGAIITDWNGERIGLWYSVRDWRDKGSATLAENNQVIVKVPIFTGTLRRQREKIPTQDEFDF
jgi:hypothetical protein